MQRYILVNDKGEPNLEMEESVVVYMSLKCQLVDGEMLKINQ